MNTIACRTCARYSHIKNACSSFSLMCLVTKGHPEWMKNPLYHNWPREDTRFFYSFWKYKHEVSDFLSDKDFEL